MACCCLTFSKPTSSTTLPLNSIGFSSWVSVVGASSGAYFCLSAPKKLDLGSAGRLSRMKDAAVAARFKPIYESVMKSFGEFYQDDI